MHIADCRLQIDNMGGNDKRELQIADCRLTYRFAFRPKKETPLSQDEILATGIFSMDNQ